MTDVNLSGLVTDDDAVSSVLGVVLMVAVTIVLAAAIGVFVLGIGTGLTDTTPQTRFTMAAETGGTAGSDWVNVSVDGGSEFEAANTYVTIGGSKAWDGETGAASGYRVGAETWDGTVSAGASLAIEENGSDTIDPGDEVQVVWATDQRSAILFEETT